MKQMQLLLLIILLWGCASLPVSATPASHAQSRKVNSGGTLAFNSRYADLIVHSGNKEEAIIKEYINNIEIDELDIEISVSHNTLAVREDNREHRNKNVRIEITVPRQFTVKAELKNGDVGIKDIDGNMTIATANGDIELIQIKGAMDLSTANGDISIKNSNGDAHIATAHGDISAATSGNINATTGSGDVSLNSKNGKVEIETGSGDVSLNLEGENHGIRVKTGNGDIALHLPPSMKASVTLNSMGGDISFNHDNVNSESSGRHTYHSDLNGGGEKISCSTGHGDISVAK
jgi:DUF4097 and DUF4098 domain-containing protein YvlB